MDLLDLLPELVVHIFHQLLHPPVLEPKSKAWYKKADGTRAVCTIAEVRALEMHSH